MSAPAKAPHYWDMGTSEEGYPADTASGWLVDDLASLVKYFPDWQWGAVEIDLTLVAHEEGKSCTIGFAGGTVRGTLTAVPDPSGWVLLTAEVGGVEMFRGYMDRPWEMYEIWPPGATPGMMPDGREEGPGRMGKKMAWVGLDERVWPSVLPLVEADGGVMFQVDDARLSARMEREGKLRGR